MMPTYYHGGAPDLKMILPPNMTGAKSTAEYGAAKVCNTDKVYITTDPMAAQVFAAFHPSMRGTVYIVEPEGKIEDDPDCDQKGLSFQCNKAKVVAAKQLDFLIAKTIRGMMA